MTQNGKRLLFVNMTQAPEIILNIGYSNSKGVLMYTCLTAEWGMGLDSVTSCEAIRGWLWKADFGFSPDKRITP